jgi:cytochrome oxidase Cu insertion factor (SCO1/SenC/PrrC family)
VVVAAVAAGAAAIRGSAWSAAFVAALVALALGPRAAVAAQHDALRIPLVDQLGAPFSLGALHGEPVVVTFVATRCTDACPIANEMFSRLDERLRKDHVRARLVTVTLDPAFDTPFVMARFAREYRADPRTWELATGKVSDVRALMGAFGVVAPPGAGGVPDAHTSFVYVLDGRGHLARTLLLSTNIVDEAAKLLREGVG